MTYEEAVSTQRRYVCATCYGHLAVSFDRTGNSEVRCAKGDNCSGRGFVTKSYAERRKSESVAELAEVNYVYGRMFSKPKTEAQLLKELGF